MRAVRGIGQAMGAQGNAGLMAKGTRGVVQEGMQGTGGSESDPPVSEPEEPKPITLAEAGIDEHLADKAMIFSPSRAKAWQARLTRHAR
jgi:hypothetical protein